MDLKHYTTQCMEDSERWFPSVHQEPMQALGHHTLALCGEVGELANLLKKLQRGDREMDRETWLEMCLEATDVQIYLFNIYALLQMDADEMYELKREVNEARFARGEVPYIHINEDGDTVSLEVRSVVDPAKEANAEAASKARHPAGKSLSPKEALQEEASTGLHSGAGDSSGDSTEGDTGPDGSVRERPDHDGGDEQEEEGGLRSV